MGCQLEDSYKEVKIFEDFEILCWRRLGATGLRAKRWGSRSPATRPLLFPNKSNGWPEAWESSRLLPVLQQVLELLSIGSEGLSHPTWQGLLTYCRPEVTLLTNWRISVVERDQLLKIEKYWFFYNTPGRFSNNNDDVIVSFCVGIPKYRISSNRISSSIPAM